MGRGGQDNLLQETRPSLVLKRPRRPGQDQERVFQKEVMVPIKTRRPSWVGGVEGRFWEATEPVTV